MIALEQAVAIVDQVTFNPETETISIMDSLGRVLAEDIISKINMPPFNKSAMDGYAISQEDNSKKFMVVETIAAGSMPTKTIHQGQCSKIMTGTPYPPVPI